VVVDIQHRRLKEPGVIAPGSFHLLMLLINRFWFSSR
jgi:hypothetical protein